MLFLNMGSRERTIWAFLLGACLTALCFLAAKAAISQPPQSQAPSISDKGKEHAMLQGSARLRAQDWPGAEVFYSKAV